MAKYRLFEKNPVTNEWIDRGFAEVDGGQQDAIRSIASEGGEYFAVPGNSFHPVKIGKREVLSWEYTEDGDGAAATVEPVEA